ncbi:MAG TPA: FKBP-type peptidyl-prolyl cis-trans isomerase [Bacteroidales bacterium]|jgi:FKBP-type peptidyl-prolyl cis-trans isomerase|nr:FKBP-type peptidyl-prolyl cis-trans isomerase [Bacteroidales bacterium]HOB27621.1 FKBP-type peptidyl-prolyl cis-trans isomerase [Bacteroidales bacterium]HPU46548.1 FKBP-type peptidyl-prolyl cis-trans isomerase [Bacteroidales bacterium]HPZ37117.1 FKBP-type peptidyl-prolyl cis-trans isomerase [Bacteroidales bacterium]HQD35160.1 FKBP-type peptidyl-prolyl cis-trans isomerase [Bacteroidales bacterium]
MEKKVFVITILSLFAIYTCNAQNDSSRSKNDKKNSKSVTNAPLQFNTFKDTVSYLIGTDLAKNFINNQLDIDINYLKAGYEDVLNNVDTIFTDQEFQSVMQKLQKIAMEKSEAKRLEEAKLNKEVGQKFLESNKNNPGVYQTPSGLQYKVIKMGEGPKPTSTDKVKVHYEGKLINGKVFDSSYERGEPIEFGLNQVIPGWAEGLTLMPVGSVFELYIPSDLAYGDRPIGEIPAGSTLIFKVELLEIVK